MSFRDGMSPAERAASASAQVQGCGLGPVEWVANTGSTNADLMAAAAAGAAHGLIRVADHQDAGRGRRDRRWHAAPGDALLMSVLLRPRMSADELGVVTAAVGIAAAEACRALGFEAVSIKWPNDLVVGLPGAQRKLAGILAQSQVAPDGPAVVVGMGMNVQGGRLGPFSESAVALDQLGTAPDPVTLLVEIVRRLAGWLPIAERADPTTLWDAYRELSATLGQAVRADLDGQVIEGRAIEITPAGALVIENIDGRHEIVVGDVVSLRVSE